MTAGMFDLAEDIDLSELSDAACQLPDELHSPAFPCTHEPVAVFRTSCGIPKVSGAIICQGIVDILAIVQDFPNSTGLIRAIVMGSSPRCQCGLYPWECWTAVPL